MMSDTFDQTYADFSAARRAQIVARIEAACARAGRDVSEVSPVAVSKTVGTGELLAAWRAGWRRFAENRPQELTRKLAFVEQTPEMAGAGQVSERSERHGAASDVLLEVNVSGEASKSGFSPDGLRACVDDVLACPGIRVRGLMTMAPKADPDCARRTFSGLRELAGELRGRTGLALPVLSCGMSDDFEIAIEEGSTLVRLGRVAFDPAYPIS